MSKIRNFDKIYEGKARPDAVWLFCHECNGYDGHREKKAHISYQEAGQYIKDCTNKRCPLYPYRLRKKEPVIVDWEHE